MSKRQIVKSASDDVAAAQINDALSPKLSQILLQRNQISTELAEKELEISKCGIKYGQCEYKSFLYSTYIFFSWENTFENTCDCLIFDSRPKYLCTFPQPPINMLRMIIPFAQAGGCIIWYVGHTVVYWWYRAAQVTFRIYHFSAKGRFPLLVGI